MIKKTITLLIFSSALCINTFSMENPEDGGNVSYPHLKRSLFADENDENQNNNHHNVYVTPSKLGENRAVDEPCVLSSRILPDTPRKKASTLSARKLKTKSASNVNVRNIHVSPDQSEMLEVRAKGIFEIDPVLLFKDEKIEFGAESKLTTLDLFAGMYHLTKHRKLTNDIRSKIQTDSLPGNFASFELKIIGSDDYEESYTSDEIFVSGVIDSDDNVLSCAHYKLAYDVLEGEEERACSELALLGFLDEQIDNRIEQIKEQGIDLQKLQLKIYTERDLCFNCKRVVPDWAKKKSTLYRVPVHVIALSQLDYCTPKAPCCRTCPYIPTLKMSKKKKKEKLIEIENSQKEKVLRTPERKNRFANFEEALTDSESENSVIANLNHIFSRTNSNSEEESSVSFASGGSGSDDELGRENYNKRIGLTFAPTKKEKPGKSIFPVIIARVMGDTVKTLF